MSWKPSLSYWQTLTGFDCSACVSFWRPYGERVSTFRAEESGLPEWSRTWTASVASATQVGHESLPIRPKMGRDAQRLTFEMPYSLCCPWSVVFRVFWGLFVGSPCLLIDVGCYERVLGDYAP